jgi:hypothetical protein
MVDPKLLEGTEVFNCLYKMAQYVMRPEGVLGSRDEDTGNCLTLLFHIEREEGTFILHVTLF